MIKIPFLNFIRSSIKVPKKGSPQSMLLSKKIQCGCSIPDFRLPDKNGNFFSKERLLSSSGLCLIFLSETNLYVKHVRDVLVKLLVEYQSKGLSTAAICPVPEITTGMVSSEEADQFEYPFPILYDFTTKITQSFGVSRIPDFFVFDKSGILKYHGRMDASKPENGKPVTGGELREALNALILGTEITSRQRPAFGTRLRYISQL